MSLLDNIKSLLVASLASVSFFMGGLLGYAIFHDYILVKLYNISSDLQALGLIGNNILLSIESTITWASIIPSILDKLWFFGFMFFVVELCIATYNTKREGYFSTLGMLTYGIIILMFVSGIVGTISLWYKGIIYNIIPVLAQDAPLFNFYMNNLGVINLVLSIGLILLNFIDIRALKTKSIPKQIPQQSTSENEI